MKAEYKTRWLEALRSGKYTQGVGRLRSKQDKFCCLGVLCDVVDNTRWIHSQGGIDCYEFEDCVGQVPDELEEFLEMNITQGELIHLNDTEHKSFAEIADFIETRE